MFLHSGFYAIYFYLHSHNKVMSKHETGVCFDKEQEFMEVGAASARGRETKSLGLY